MTAQSQTDLLGNPMPAFRIGRQRTTHRARVLIEDGKVVIRAACGLLRDVEDGFTESFGWTTCSDCEAQA
ncbi:MAG TPA: hypothetical protein VFQ11_10880 [Nocardioidaceae bacterium]|nr:hypothetical protein [Nocardioidaceae bacterium]